MMQATDPARHKESHSGASHGGLPRQRALRSAQPTRGKPAAARVGGSLGRYPSAKSLRRSRSAGGGLRIEEAPPLHLRTRLKADFLSLEDSFLEGAEYPLAVDSVAAALPGRRPYSAVAGAGRRGGGEERVRASSAAPLRPAMVPLTQARRQVAQDPSFASRRICFGSAGLRAISARRQQGGA